MVSYEESRRILGVSADATTASIRQAYLDLARVWHPDRFQSDERLRKIAEDHLREINEAYAVLKNRRRQAAASGEGATAAEKPPPARPDSGPRPQWTSWTPQPSVRPTSPVLLSRYISKKVG